MKLKTIVVGFDDTDPSRHALERAADLAEAFGAKLAVTSVAPLLVGIGRSAGPLDPVDSPQEHREQLQDARKLLEARNIKAASMCRRRASPPTRSWSSRMTWTPT